MPTYVSVVTNEAEVQIGYQNGSRHSDIDVSW